MKIINIIIVTLIVNILSCMLPSDPLLSIPMPTTTGIIPLTSNNSWTYSFAYYDSLGKCIESKFELNLEISATYYKIRDSLYSIRFETDSLRPYYYKYEYESFDSGLFVMNRTSGNEPRGTYIAGTYNKKEYKLFVDPVLWLPYPADSGKKWDVTMEGDTIVSHMELVSTNSTYYFVSNGNQISPVCFKEKCYLYKEVAGEIISYYYYHKDVGMIAFQRYEKGMMRRSALLTEYRLY